MNEEEDDTVRLNSEDQRVWLVKVPLRVARKWDEAKADDALLGKLQVHNASDSKGKWREETAKATRKESEQRWIWEG